MTNGDLSTATTLSMEPEVQAAISISLSTIWGAAQDFEGNHSALGESFYCKSYRYMKPHCVYIIILSSPLALNVDLHACMALVRGMNGLLELFPWLILIRSFTFVLVNIQLFASLDRPFG